MRERFNLVVALRKRYAHFLRPSELVVLCAVVKRTDVSRLKSKGRHQLVITSSARVLCLDQECTNIVLELSVAKYGGLVHIDNKGAREFTIVGDDKRKGIFIDVLGDPSRWINAAMHAAKLAAGTQESAVDQLVRSDIYQPDSMLRHQGYLVKRSLISAANWQKRWIVLHGHTIYWFKGADTPKGQLQLSAGSTVSAYTGQDALNPRAASVAALGRPNGFVVRTPELAANTSGGKKLMLLLDAPDAATRDDWMGALCAAIPGGTKKSSSAPTLDAEGSVKSAPVPLSPSAVFDAAKPQSYLLKRSVHPNGFGVRERWQRRWCALHQGTIYWYAGAPSNAACALRGQLVLTPGTKVSALGPRAHAFAVATPEMERAGLLLGLQAEDASQMRLWLDGIAHALGQPPAETKRL